MELKTLDDVYDYLDPVSPVTISDLIKSSRIQCEEIIKLKKELNNMKEEKIQFNSKFYKVSTFKQYAQERLHEETKFMWLAFIVFCLSMGYLIYN